MHQRSFKHRLTGAVLLKPRVYAGLKSDSGAWVQSAWVIVAVAFSHGLGAVLRAPSQGYSEPGPLTFLFGFAGEILLWIGTAVFVSVGVRLLSARRVGFPEIARPLAFAAAPGLAVVLAGALSGVGRTAVPLLAVMAAWRLAASYVAVREVLAVSPARAAAWLAFGLLGGVGLMGAGTALLNQLGSG